MALEKFVNAYVARTPRSREIYEDARKVLPGGVSGNAKFLKPYPLYVKRARGSHVIDVDGNDYVDLLDAVGAAILGHGHESIRRAVKEQIDEAILPLMATELEVKLAQKVSRLMDYMEMIRFVNSGSEATLMAMRAARAFTGYSPLYPGTTRGRRALNSSPCSQGHGSLGIRFGDEQFRPAGQFCKSQTSPHRYVEPSSDPVSSG